MKLDTVEKLAIAGWIVSMMAIISLVVLAVWGALKGFQVI